MTKRFRIIARSGRIQNVRYDTIKEVVSDLLTRNLAMESYTVEDLEDDIEIDADDLMEAWNEGERPEDLQMF